MIEGKISELSKATHSNSKELKFGNHTNLGDVLSKTVDLESKVWQRYYQRIKDILPKYPNTLQEDLDMLEKDDKENHLTVNERNIINVRATEKQIIKLNMEYA